MKKLNLICILLCSVVIFSCKKDKKEPIKTGNGLRALSFKLPGFSQSKSPLDAAGSSLKTNAVTPPDSLPQIIYKLYDSNGNVIRTIIHLPNDPNYNNFTDSVPAGAYTAVFAAGYSQFNVSANQLSSGYFWYYDPAHDDITTRGAVIWRDAFYKKLPLVVNDQDITQSVELQRPLAKIALNVEDAIPANVKRIAMTFNEVYLQYLFSQGQFAKVDMEHGLYVTLTNSNSTVALVAGSTNNQVSALTGTLGIPVQVTISCYDAGNNVILQKKVTVTCQSNKVTLISGKLFNTSGANSFNVTTNTTWNPDKTPIHF